jgi:uncharacterized OB-fold protein
MFQWFGKVNFVPYTKVSEFARHLKDGRLMASKCKACGDTSFPPRADCAACTKGEFEFTEITGKARLHTFTKISAAPTGFEDVAPYTIGVADLDGGGRILAWIGDTIPEPEITIDMELQVVPRIFEEEEEIKVYYSLEKPGTAWSKGKSG